MLQAKGPILIQGYVWKWKITNDKRTANVGHLGQSRDRAGCTSLMTENQTVKAHALSAWFIQLPPTLSLPSEGWERCVSSLGREAGVEEKVLVETARDPFHFQWQLGARTFLLTSR